LTVGQLIAPEGDDEILDLDAEALALKPVMTGDVFSGVRVPGEPEPLDVMVAGHPCTIRRGVELVVRVPCVRLVQHEWLAYDNWPRYDKNHFPISAAVGLGDGRCASLWDWIGVPREELVRTRRRVTLQDQGIYVFLQRLIYSFSRFPPPLTVLREASAHVLVEAELEYSWVLALLDGEPDEQKLAQLSGEFGVFMSAEDRRSILRTDRKRVAAQVEAEITRQQNAPPAEP
jgi:hypothetical protein